MGMEKLFVCFVFFCSFLVLTSSHGDQLIKQCMRQVKLQHCSDEKCSPVCKKVYPTLQAAYCLQDYGLCQCYFQCNVPPYEDCWYRKKLPGCGIDNCDEYCSKHYSPDRGSTCESPDLCSCHIPC